MRCKDERLQEMLQWIESRDYTHDEKILWKNVISSVMQYQENLLQEHEPGRIPEKDPQFSWTIECGIMDPLHGRLDKQYSFVSDADDMKAKHFPFGNPENKKRIPMDGDWQIIGTGYLDTSYDRLKELCGRDHLYEGRLPDGETFAYTLILQDHIRKQEELLYQIVSQYHIQAPVIHASMLRRLVYFETKAELPADVKYNDLDFQLEENGLSFLKQGWRAFWNVIVSVSPPQGIKNGNTLRFDQEPGVFYLAADDPYNVIHREEQFDEERHKTIIRFSCDSDMDLKYRLQQISVCAGYLEKKDTRTSYQISFINHGAYNTSVSHIRSRADVEKALSAFQCVAELEGIYTTYPEGMKVFSYDSGLDYPEEASYLQLNGRPTLYLAFRENQPDDYFQDRIIYVVHALQRYYPEYIWKGGCIHA